MYSRYPNYRFGSGVRVPENYSGNAFGAKTDEIEDGEYRSVPEYIEESAAEHGGDAPPSREDGELSSAEPEGESVEASATKRRGFSLPSFRFGSEKLFGSFGFEELLIIALIFLVSAGEKDDDIILFLALLLFVS